MFRSPLAGDRVAGVRVELVSAPGRGVARVAAVSGAEEFRRLHHAGEILLMPNAWDAGSARILRHLGFRAVATTSGGAAAARGTTDGALGPDEVLAHCRELAGAVDVPVSADLEDCFAADADGVAGFVDRARATGITGASIEDWDGTRIRDLDTAVERVRAAVGAASGDLVVTARADNHFRGIDDLDDTITRLRAFAAAGADVVYAPGLRTHDEIRAVVDAVDVPVNVLALPGVPPVAELEAIGVARVSVGATFAMAAYSALLDAGRELQDGGYGFCDRAATGRPVLRDALSRSD